MPREMHSTESGGTRSAAGRSKRRRAREEAIKALYEIDLNPGPAEVVINRPRTGEQRVSGAVRAFAVELVNGVLGNREEIDSSVVRFANRQRLDRMAVVDRNILRLAAYELLFRPDIPVEATLNEAVELAALFGDAETASFVNGLLDRLVREMDIRNRKQVPGKAAS